MHSNPKLLGNWSEQRSSAKNVKSAPRGLLALSVSEPLLKPMGPAGRRKGPSWGLPRAVSLKPHPIKTPQEPPELPGWGSQGGWDTVPFPAMHRCQHQGGKSGWKTERDPTTDSPGEGSRAQERASQRPGTKSQTLNQ